MELMDSKINLIFVKPRRHDRYRYFLNEDLQKSYAGNFDRVYDFIVQTAPTVDLSKVEEYLMTYTPFVVIVEDNEVIRLDIDRKLTLEVIRDSLKVTELSDTILKSIQEKSKKDLNTKNSNMVDAFYRRKLD